MSTTDANAGLAGAPGSAEMQDDEIRILEENEANNEAERCYWRLLCQT